MDTPKDSVTYIDEQFDTWFIRALSDFVRVPNLTMQADKDFATNGLIQQAIEIVDKYITELDVKGIQRQIFHPEGTNPLVVYVIEPSDDGQTQNLMIYGHLDKQLWGTGWNEGLTGNDPVIKGDLMYGRGSIDDGYCPFAAILAVKALQETGCKHPRIVLVLETEEESGSPNLINLLDQASSLIQTPDLCIVLDAGGFDASSMWLTTSFRGLVVVDLTVEAAKVEKHSGLGGIIPETFRIARNLLDRLDDSKTGKVSEDLQTSIPDLKYEEAKLLAPFYTYTIKNLKMLHDGVLHVDEDNVQEVYLNNVWRSNISVTAAEGLPAIDKSGNVLRPSTTLRLSIRLCPNLLAQDAIKIIEEKLTRDVAHNAKITLKFSQAGNGWVQKDLDQSVHNAFNQASQKFMDGKSCRTFGNPGSIPFVYDLQNQYPDTQMLITGACTPGNSIHAPNEHINLPHTKKVIKVISHFIQLIGEKQ
eukprot:403336761